MQSAAQIPPDNSGVRVRSHCLTYSLRNIFTVLFFCLKAHDATSGGTSVQQHAVLINDLCGEYLASAQISTNIYLCLDVVVDTALYKTLFPLLPLASDL